MTMSDLFDIFDYVDEDHGTEVFDPDFDGTEEDGLDPEYLPSWER